MRHVDDGTIHAWLDGQVGDPAEAAWIEQHVRTCAACAARLAEERSTFEQANALLADAPPAAAAPAFSTIAHRAAVEQGDNDEQKNVAPRRRHEWLTPRGWAASVMLAVGVGWLARDLTTTPDALIVQEPTETRASERTTATPIEQPAAPEPSAMTAQELLSVTRSGGPSGPQEPVTRRGGPSGPQAQPTAPAVQAPSGLRAEAGEVPASPADLQRGAIASAPAASAPPPPVAPIETSAQQAADLTAAATPVAAPAAPVPPLAELVTVTGSSPARTETAANAAEWRTLPRTEAAAQSGMALYGISGMEPLLTSVSPDGRIVRTTYRIATGELVEIEQRRSGPEAPPMQDVQSTARALTRAGRAGVAANAARPGSRVLSIARGDVQITLRTASEAPDLSALAARLRVD